jgi:hypothetical protein
MVQRSSMAGVVGRARLRIFLLVMVIVLAVSLAAAPQMVAIGCEPVGGGCYCPGC